MSNAIDGGESDGVGVVRNGRAREREAARAI